MRLNEDNSVAVHNSVAVLTSPNRCYSGLGFCTTHNNEATLLPITTNLHLQNSTHTPINARKQRQEAIFTHTSHTQ